MKGEIALVRGYHDEPRVLRIWEDAGRTVYVSAPDQYELLLLGQEALPPVGVPREDVYRYAEGTNEAIAGGRFDWASAERR